MKRWIRPVYTGGVLTGIALCRHNGPPVVDSDILEHFPWGTPGTEIEACAVEFHGATSTEWGKPINNKK